MAMDCHWNVASDERNQSIRQRNFASMATAYTLPVSGETLECREVEGTQLGYTD